MDRIYSLSEIQPGEQAVVCAVCSEGCIRTRLMDIGLIEGTCVECLGRSPGGKISAYFIRGAVVAIRAEDCCDIWVRPLEEEWGW